MNYPSSINFCLSYANIKPNDLDVFAIVSKNDEMSKLVNRIDLFQFKTF